MIKKSFIKKQTEKARKQRKTPQFLRRLTLHVVDNVLKKHYETSYPTKCLQSSFAIEAVLEKLSINSKVITGAVCVSQAFKEENKLPSWNGFWGDAHHVWIVTEFGELVDLTIRYLHIHPQSIESKQLPMPALWWEDLEYWPKIIQYMHQGPVNPVLPEDDMKDLALFKEKAKKELDDVIGHHIAQDIVFSPILHGTNSMNELYAHGDRWLKSSLKLQEFNVPHPDWVNKRIAELTKPYTI